MPDLWSLLPTRVRTPGDNSTAQTRCLTVSVEDDGAERARMQITQDGTDYIIKSVAMSRTGDIITHERVLSTELDWWNPWVLIHTVISTFEDDFLTGDFDG